MNSLAATKDNSLVSHGASPHSKVTPNEDVIVILNKMQAIFNLYSVVPPNTLVVPALRVDAMEKLKAARTMVLSQLLNADVKTARTVLKHSVLWEAKFKGLLHQPLESLERNVVEQIRESFVKGWKEPLSENMLAIMMLYFQAHDLPLLTEHIETIDFELAHIYLSYCVMSPLCIQRGDDKKHADHLIRFLDWCAVQIENPKNHAWAIPNLIPTIQKTDICAVFHADIDAFSVARARARLVKALNALLDSRLNHNIAPYTRKVLPSRGRKIRIGYIVSTLGQGSDLQVILAEIGKFDATKIEVYLYSRDVQDQAYQHNASFYRRLFAKVSEVRSLLGLSAEKIVNLIRKDDLDIFVFHAASHFGFESYDLVNAHRVAPVQVVLSRMIAMSTWYDNYDYYLIPRVRDDLLPILQKQASETLRIVPGTLLAYDRGSQASADMIIDRTALGVRDDEIMFLCGGAATKIVPAVCECFARILAESPKSKLVLATLHPAHGGERLLPMLELRMGNALKKYGLSRDRIIIVNRLEPQDVPQLLNLADVYLSQWPLGGATWIMMALEAATPLVVKDSDLLHGIGNQSLMRGSGFEELVAYDEDAYVRMAVDLAKDRGKRDAIREKLKATSAHMQHNDLDTFSYEMQECYISLVDEMSAKYIS